MPKFESRILTENEYPLWDRFVDNSPQGTVFHKSYWIKATNIYKEFKIKIIGVFNDNELVGGCAFHVKNLLFSKLIYSPFPMTAAYCGIILKEVKTDNVRKRENFHNNIIKAVLSQINSPLYYSIICNHPKLYDVRQFKWLNWKIDTVYTYIIQLKKYKGKEEFLKSVSNSARRAIKNAKKSKVMIKKELNARIIYDLHKETFDYHGLRQRPLRFFESVYNEFGKTIKAHQYNPYKDKKLLSSILFIEDNKNFYYWIGGSIKKSSLFNSPSLIVYEAVSDFLPSNKTLDFVGATKEHIANFESAFNPDLVPYYYAYRMNLIAKTLHLFHRMHNRIKHNKG